MHIRSTDGGFVHIFKKQNIYLFIEDYINKNPKHNIYIACDSLQIENNIKKQFPTNILYFENPFGNSYEDKFNRNTYGVINGVCEMYILSKCDKFLGTPGSSFSFMIWLLRNEVESEFWYNYS